MYIKPFLAGKSGSNTRGFLFEFMQQNACKTGLDSTVANREGISI